MIKKLIGLALSSLALSVSAAPIHYHEIGRIPIKADGGWDYMYADGSAHRLYVSHGTQVIVIDTKAMKIVGTIEKTNGVHGIAIAPKLHRGFTSNGRDNAVTVFDTRTLKTLGVVPVGSGCDAIVFEPKSDRIFTFNGGSQDATAIDAKTMTVVGTIPLGGRPEFAAADGNGGLWDNIESTNELVSIDPMALTIKSRWSVAPGDGPSGLAVDPKTDHLFSVCDGTMVISDGEAGKVITTVPIGQGPDAAGYDPELNVAFSSNGEGTLSVVQSNPDGTFSVLENVPTQRSGRTMAIDTKTHQVFIIAAKFGPAPARVAGQRYQRPPIVPGSTDIIVYAP